MVGERMPTGVGRRGRERYVGVWWAYGTSADVTARAFRASDRDVGHIRGGIITLRLQCVGLTVSSRSNAL